MDTYTLIIGSSAIIILSFFFSEVSRKTNVPSVLMLIILGVSLKNLVKIPEETITPILKALGTVGVIMIVLEAALELELKKEKYIPIIKAFVIALVGLIASAGVAAVILNYFIEGMTMEKAWLYATPLSILSSAIIIPSVSALSLEKKEFHIYESTFSDILGIMMFIFLTGQFENGDHDTGGGAIGFGGNVILTLVISIVASYLIILIFQNIRSHTKLFLLIAVLLLLYGIGQKMHLSSLLIIFIFGLILSNMKLFFKGKLGEWLHLERANHVYEGLHIVTMETAFVIRTFFFVFFGLSIVLSSLLNGYVAIVSILIIVSIYVLRFVVLRLFIGSDIIPQLYIAPRGLITILLFYKIPEKAEVLGFDPGILLFVIIGTSLIMTVAMVLDKQKTDKAIRKVDDNPIGYERWKAPSVSQSADDTGDAH